MEFIIDIYLRIHPHTKKRGKITSLTDQKIYPAGIENVLNTIYFIYMTHFDNN